VSIKKTVDISASSRRTDHRDGESAKAAFSIGCTTSSNLWPK